MTQKRGLGRGLGALIPGAGSAPAAAPTPELRTRTPRTDSPSERVASERPVDMFFSGDRVGEDDAASRGRSNPRDLAGDMAKAAAERRGRGTRTASRAAAEEEKAPSTRRRSSSTSAPAKSSPAKKSTPAKKSAAASSASKSTSSKASSSTTTSSKPAAAKSSSSKAAASTSATSKQATSKATPSKAAASTSTASKENSASTAAPSTAAAEKPSSSSKAAGSTSADESSTPSASTTAAETPASTALAPAAESAPSAPVEPTTRVTAPPEEETAPEVSTAESTEAPAAEEALSSPAESSPVVDVQPVESTPAQARAAASGTEEIEEPAASEEPSTTEEPVASASDDASLLPVPGAEFAEIPIHEIRENPRNPRTLFDDDELDELAFSVRHVGVLQPVVVRPIPVSEDGESFELVMGERRWRAARRAGLPSIPAIIRETSDDDLLRDALLENLHRSQLNPLEEAAAYQQLLDDFGCTQDELGERIGRSRPQITNTLRLLRLPALVQRRLASGALSAGHARALLSLDDPSLMEELAQRIVSEGLSVRAVERLVARGGQQAPARTVRRSSYDPHVVDLTSRLSNRLETQVRIDVGKRKGKITLEFTNLEDLERLVETMGLETSVED
ncbi:hypothetical protein GCM10009592_09400 [Brachybacterium rhamnosum]|uniref:ParB/RepB/Spo0J family partition protein n=1 Tax=Brachybacterium rhamnosum TaxID=173361 RepID=A0ABW4PVT6_9MICO